MIRRRPREMQKVKIYWPREVGLNVTSNIYVWDIEDLIRRMKGWSFKVSDANLPKGGYSWKVWDLCREKCNEENCMCRNRDKCAF